MVKKTKNKAEEIVEALTTVRESLQREINNCEKHNLVWLKLAFENVRNVVDAHIDMYKELLE